MDRKKRAPSNGSAICCATKMPTVSEVREPYTNSRPHPLEFDQSLPS